MKIVYKIFLKNDIILKYMFLFVLLLFFFFIITNLNDTLSNSIYKKNNKLDNRRIMVSLIQKEYIHQIEKFPQIKKIKMINELDYELIFKDYRDVNTFVESNDNYYTKITYFGDTNETKNVLFYLNSILKIASIIILIVLFSIFAICIIESFLNFIPDISLLKLIGMTNNYLLITILKFYFLLFSVIFLICYSIMSLVIILFNYFGKYLQISFTLANLDFLLILKLYFMFVILILILVNILNKKIKKISPISFVKKNTNL